MELSYVFASPFTGISIDSGAPEGYADVDQRLSRSMMLLWTNFAKYGYIMLSVVFRFVASIKSCLASRDRCLRTNGPLVSDQRYFKFSRPHRYGDILLFVCLSVCRFVRLSPTCSCRPLPTCWSCLNCAGRPATSRDAVNCAPRLAATSMFQDVDYQHLWQTGLASPASVQQHGTLYRIVWKTVH